MIWKDRVFYSRILKRILEHEHQNQKDCTGQGPLEELRSPNLVRAYRAQITRDSPFIERKDFERKVRFENQRKKDEVEHSYPKKRVKKFNFIFSSKVSKPEPQPEQKSQQQENKTWPSSYTHVAELPTPPSSNKINRLVDDQAATGKLDNIIDTDSDEPWDDSTGVD